MANCLKFLRKIYTDDLQFYEMKMNIEIYFQWSKCNLCHQSEIYSRFIHDDVIKWKHFPCYWPFVWGIHRSPVNSPHKGQWRGALMFSLICVWINGWANTREAGDLRRYRAHYDVTVAHSDPRHNVWNPIFLLVLNSPISQLFFP